MCNEYVGTVVHDNFGLISSIHSRARFYCSVIKFLNERFECLKICCIFNLDL